MSADNTDLTQSVIGPAMKVLNVLRPNLDEKRYERALVDRVIELRKRGICCDQQKAHDVFYEGELLGSLVPDLIVDDRFIVDPKVVTAFNEKSRKHKRSAV